MPKTTNEIIELYYRYKNEPTLWFSQDEVGKIISDDRSELNAIHKGEIENLVKQLKKALKSMINDEGCVFGTDIDEVFAQYGLVTEKVPSLKVSDDLVDEGNTPKLRTVAEGENPSKPNNTYKEDKNE